MRSAKSPMAASSIGRRVVVGGGHGGLLLVAGSSSPSCPRAPDRGWRRQAASTVSWSWPRRRIPGGQRSGPRSAAALRRARSTAAGGSCCCSARRASARRPRRATLAAAARRTGVIVRWSACWSGGATVAHAPWLTLLSGLGAAGPRRARVVARLRRRRRDGGGGRSQSGLRRRRRRPRGGHRRAAAAARARRPPLGRRGDPAAARRRGRPPPGAAGAGRRHLPDTEVAPGSPLTRLGGGADRVELHGLDDARRRRRSSSAHVGAGRAAELAPRSVGSPPATRSSSSSSVACWPTTRARWTARRCPRAPAICSSSAWRSSLPTSGRCSSPRRCSEVRSGRSTLATVARRATAPRSRSALDRAAGAADRGAGARHRCVGLRARPLPPGRRSDGRRAHRGRRAPPSAPPTALAAADAEAAVIAAHLLAARADDHAAAAARWSVRAGDRALAALAWEEAAAHYERALSAVAGAGGPDDVRADALAGLGRARLLARRRCGRGRRVRRAGRPRPRAAARPSCWPGAALGWSVDLSGFEVRLFDQRQIDLLEEAARALSETDPPAPGLRATVLARLSVALSLVAPDERRLGAGRGGGGAGPRRRRADRAGPCPRRPLRRHRRPRPERRPRGGGERDHRHRARRRATASLELLGRRLRYVARLEQGDVGGVEEDMAAFARRADAVGNPLYSVVRAAVEGPAGRSWPGDGDAALAGIAEVEALGRGRRAAPTLRSWPSCCAWCVLRAGRPPGARSRCSPRCADARRSSPSTSRRSGRSPWPTTAPAATPRRGPTSTGPRPLGLDAVPSTPSGSRT